MAADLSDSKFNSTSLKGAYLADANLSAVQFIDIDVSGTDFSNALFTEQTTFEKAYAVQTNAPIGLPPQYSVELMSASDYSLKTGQRPFKITVPEKIRPYKTELR